ncbi:MAG: rimM [Caulobacteraceae bacterium]|nr:rimM [Caulobacteraceae bacterium]
MTDLILIGRVAGAFGIRGEVRIHAYTADPLALKAYKTLLNKAGQAALTVKSAKPAANGVIVSATEVADRDAAEALKGLDLYVPRSALPEPDDDEFYITDLIGLEVRTPEGDAIGVVGSVENYGAGDLLDIKPLGGGPSWLLEFTRENVPALDIAGGNVTAIRPTEAE